MILSRRGFLGGILAAPAIVRVSSIMPVKLWDEWDEPFVTHNIKYSGLLIRGVDQWGRPIEEFLPIGRKPQIISKSFSQVRTITLKNLNLSIPVDL